MKYKNWCQKLMLGIFFLAMVMSLSSYVVDPIGMWNHPIIQGVNQYKDKQALYLDVYKPFEYRYYKSDVIYIGSSRIYVGWRPEENAYNWGTSSLSLPDIRAYLQYVYSQHTPQKVYIGLDLFQFAQTSVHDKRKGFSEERIINLARGGWSAYQEMAVTNMAMSSEVVPTIARSFLNRNDESPLFIRGYSMKRGETSTVNAKEYYHNLHSYYDTYEHFVYDEEALNILRSILLDAEDNGVEVVLFFNPISVDLLALQDICHVADYYDKIKQEVAGIHPVYDFAWLNNLTVDREKHWLDGSHYHGSTGELLKLCVNGDVDKNICNLLTAENVQNIVLEEKKFYKKWSSQHGDYLLALNKVSANKETKEGSLQEYIGF